MPSPSPQPAPATSPQAPPLPLVINSVTAGYDPGVPIVQELSGQLHPGELCALIGPNAAGKSTLMRLAMGQLRPWAGQVSICGQDSARLSPQQRARLVSFVPQRGHASFAFTVGHVVAMGRFALPWDALAFEEALRTCELLDLRQRIYSQLSVGQQQRVLLARALYQTSAGGQMMLLDEPGSAMDLWHLHHTMELLQAQARQGRAVLVVIHDLNLAARYADAVWLMSRGQLVAAGPWRQVLTPAVLEPVYRVHLRELSHTQSPRPVFAVDSLVTL